MQRRCQGTPSLKGLCSYFVQSELSDSKLPQGALHLFSLALLPVQRSAQQMLCSTDSISKPGPSLCADVCLPVTSKMLEQPDWSSLQGVTSCHQLFQLGEWLIFRL